MPKTENTIPAVDKAVRLLNQLSGSNSGLSQTELAKANGISGATCYRILQSLLKHGWVRKNEGKYLLSTGLLPVAKYVSKLQQWQERVQEPLERLCRETRLSVKLSMRQGEKEYITAYRVESPEPMAVSGKVGAAFPVVEGTVGAALLSGCSDEEIRRLMEAAPEDIPEKKSPEIFYEHLSRCRREGYCSSCGYNRWGIEVISTPLCDESGKVIAAISILCLPDNLRAKPELPQMLLNTRKECEAVIC